MLIGIGIAIGIAVGRRSRAARGLGLRHDEASKARRIRDQLLDDARARERRGAARGAGRGPRAGRPLRSEIDAELADRRAQVLKIEERVLAKEDEIERKLEELGAATRASPTGKSTSASCRKS